MQRIAVVVAAATFATAACGGDGGDCCTEPSRSEAARGWEELPGPGTSNAALVAVGETVLVVGGGEVRALREDGLTTPVEIPGGATGGGPVVGTDDELIVVTAGIAYEPEGGTWRDVPGGRGAVDAALWTGDSVVVLSDAGRGGGRIYDTADGEPREIERPSGTVMAAVPLPGGVVVWTDDESEEHGNLSRLSRLDTGSGRWVELPAPPFEPQEGGTGLVAEREDRLVAAAFGGGDTEAAALDLSSGAAWEQLDPPPAPDNPACPIDLHRGEGATVFEARCSGELSVLDGDRWRSLPSPAIDAPFEVLVTADEVIALAGDGSALARRPLP